LRFLTSPPFCALPCRFELWAAFFCVRVSFTHCVDTVCPAVAFVLLPCLRRTPVCLFLPILPMACAALHEFLSFYVSSGVRCVFFLAPVGYARFSQLPSTSFVLATIAVFNALFAIVVCPACFRAALLLSSGRGPSDPGFVRSHASFPLRLPSVRLSPPFWCLFFPSRPRARRVSFFPVLCPFFSVASSSVARPPSSRRSPLPHCALLAASVAGRSLRLLCRLPLGPPVPSWHGRRLRLASPPRLSCVSWTLRQRLLLAVPLPHRILAFCCYHFADSRAFLCFCAHPVLSLIVSSFLLHAPLPLPSLVPSPSGRGPSLLVGTRAASCGNPLLHHSSLGCVPRLLARVLPFGCRSRLALAFASPLAPGRPRPAVASLDASFPLAAACCASALVNALRSGLSSRFRCFSPPVCSSPALACPILLVVFALFLPRGAASRPVWPVFRRRFHGLIGRTFSLPSVLLLQPPSSLALLLSLSLTSSKPQLRLTLPCLSSLLEFTSPAAWFPYCLQWSSVVFCILPSYTASPVPLLLR